MIEKIPAIGLGTWKATNPEELSRAIAFALDNGYQHLDCAPIYMNEKAVATGIKRAIASGSITRDQLWVTSKLWNSFHHPNDVKPALQESLKYMQLDVLDLYLIHWPVASKKELGYRHVEQVSEFHSLDDRPLAKTWEAMLRLRDDKLTRFVGVANFSIKKLEQLKNAGLPAPHVNQVECHIYLQQNELHNYCQQNNIILTAYSPLGSSDRPDTFKKPDEPLPLENTMIKSIANEHACTPAQVLLAWLLQRGMVVIPKSTNNERILENLSAKDIQLSPDNIREISTLDKHYRFVDGRFFTPSGSPYTIDSLWDE